MGREQLGIERKKREAEGHDLFSKKYSIEGKEKEKGKQKKYFIETASATTSSLSQFLSSLMLCVNEFNACVASLVPVLLPFFSSYHSGKETEKENDRFIHILSCLSDAKRKKEKPFPVLMKDIPV